MKVANFLTGLGMFLLLFEYVVAEEVTYEVDLSGFAQPDGDFIRVFGTLTVDADLPVGSAVTNFSLQFQHEGREAIPIIQLEYVGDVAKNLDWTVNGNELYIDRIGTGNSGVFWVNPSDFFFAPNALLQFASGDNDHAILAFRFEDNMIAEADGLDLRPASGPDGPNGFLVGVAETILGDVNGDGLVDLLDVGPFVELLSDSEYQLEADVNEDGRVNLLDVRPFVDLLTMNS